MTTDPTALPVLVVDDDQPTQSLLRAVLRRCGYASEAASNGREAIERLRSRTYAAVVLDMMMPEAGGRDVIDYLATVADPVPVIICSAAGPSILTGFDPAVVKAVVRKPFDVDQFIDAVTSLARTPGPSMRVLIVDDDERARYTLRAFLDAAEVTEAESGEEALEMIRNGAPDVVLLDLILPGRQGDEILPQLAASSLPVIIVTARVLGEEERQRLLQHATAVIYKGHLSRETLRDALAAVRKRREGKTDLSSSR